MIIRRLLAMALLAPIACVAADAGMSSACTVLAGGGGVASSDAQANEAWNRLNFSFFDAALTTLGATSKVVPAFFIVGAKDASRSSEAAVVQARREGCDKLMTVSVYGDAASAEGELVFSVRVAQLPRAAAAPAASDASAVRLAGKVDFEREYRYAATPDSLSKVVPSRIAERAVREYLDAVKR